MFREKLSLKSKDEKILDLKEQVLPLYSIGVAFLFNLFWFLTIYYSYVFFLEFCRYATWKFMLKLKENFQTWEFQMGKEGQFSL